MEWSIAELARMSGVTSRTLRHYEAIGLLVPARVAANGWRHYEEEQLLRLQQILVLRNLGLGLAAIAEILDHESREDIVAVLRQHRRWLIEEQERLRRQTRSIERTIGDLEEGREMTAEAMFEGFEHHPYEDEARQRWGDEVVDASIEQVKGWSPADAEKAGSGYARVHEGLGPLHRAGVPVDDDRVQELVDLHYQVTSLFWSPNAETYRGLGEMYVDDERFSATIGQGNDDLVAYLRDAMGAYAEARLD